MLAGLLFTVPAWIIRHVLFKRRMSIPFVIMYVLVLFFAQSLATIAWLGKPAAGTGLSVPASAIILLWKPREYGPDNPDYYKKRHYPGERGL